MITDIPQKPSLNELTHYGVKGMKWGVRKDRDAGGARPRAAAKPKTTSKVGSGEEAALILYGSVLAGAIILQSVAKAKDAGRFHAMKNKSNAWKQKPELTKPMSVAELHSKVVAPINPNYGEPGTKMNCRRATFAYELRRRGYDVKATKSNYATGQTDRGLAKAANKSRKSFDTIWGEKAVSTPVVMQSAKPEAKSKLIFDALAKHPNGARGELTVSWVYGGGHSIAWEIVKGKPVIFDTQNGKTYADVRAFSQFAPVVTSASVTRLDNATLNHKFLERWVGNADK